MYFIRFSISCGSFSVSSSPFSLPTKNQKRSAWFVLRCCLCRLCCLCGLRMCHLRKRNHRIVFFHKQQAEGSRSAVAGNSRRCFLQVYPFKWAVLVNQALDVAELLVVHSRIGNKQDAPVDVCRISEYPADVMFCHAGKVANRHAANCHFTLPQYDDRM